jgi:pyruvate-ferredoxin/flavodoxin oxidoreductase
MISTVMQTCFFALSGVLPKDVALDKIRQAAQKAYGKRGSEVVRRNLAAIDRTLENLFEVTVPLLPTSQRSRPDLVPATAPDFVQRVTALMLAGHGDHLPVSAFPVDGTWPLGTAVYDRRSLALQIPAWDESICIQCNKCVLICPHAAIRATVFAEEHLAGAPEGFVAVDWKEREAAPGTKFRIQVAPDDCTGCGLCVQFCPAKDKSNPRHKAIDMVPAEPRKPVEQKTFEYFQRLPAPDRRTVHLDVKGSQLLEPLFEFSGACAGCGETPYLKLLTQLFGDRLMVANATGCSSIYGGNLPTTPWSTNRDGRGPAWANSLFEDNAEFGLGFRLSLDAHRGSAQSLLRALASELGDELPAAILSATQDSEAAIAAQRERIVELKKAPDPDQSSRGPAAIAHGRLFGQKERLDRRWRWLGVRHWLWWTRSRDRVGTRPELAGARHRGLLEHRRTAVEVDADRGRRQVRRRRQGAAQKRPRDAGDDVRACLRRSRRDGRQGRAHRQVLPRG